MFIDNLKKSILQKAIQGKLVEQNPNDEPASELLKKIREEKERLIKDGKIKKEKTLTSIIDEEKPFDIPESWNWIRLGEVSSFNGGFAFKSSEYVEEWKWIRVLRISDFNEYWLVNKSPVYIPYDEKLENYKLSKWDIVMCMTGGTVWKSYLFEELEEEMYVNQRVADIKCNNMLNIKYIYTVILSNYIQAIINQSKNSTNDNISADLIRNFVIPLPPLEEQKRIVDKLDELMPLLDEARPLEEEITKLEKDFPSKLRQSILQYAIQWKLVEQDSNNESASELLKKIKEEKEKLVKEWKIKREKALESIKDEEKLFDIPSSWEWVRLGEISFDIFYWVSESAKTKWNYKLLRITDIQNNKVDWDTVPFTDYDENKVEPYLLNKWDILFARTGWTVWKSYLVKEIPDNVIYASYLIRVRLAEWLNNEYIKLFFEAPFYWNQIIDKANWSAQPNCNWQKLANLIIPLPPLEEQKRIVAKLDELLKLCDELEEQIG